MSCDPHSTLGALALASVTIGLALVLLGVAEWMDYRRFQKMKKEFSLQNFDIEN